MRGPGRSERRITVGEDYATHVEGLQRALYCAFGHIHDPQRLPSGAAQGRYAGSLIPLDYGEQQQVKQAVVVTIADDVRANPHELPAGRPLVELAGTLVELERRAADGGPRRLHPESARRVPRSPPRPSPTVSPSGRPAAPCSSSSTPSRTSP